MSENERIGILIQIDQKEVIVYEGNYQGLQCYGRRTKLFLNNQSLKHEQGIFESYDGKLLKMLAFDSNKSWNEIKGKI